MCDLDKCTHAYSLTCKPTGNFLFLSPGPETIFHVKTQFANSAPGKSLVKPLCPNMNKNINISEYSECMIRVYGVHCQ